MGPPDLIAREGPSGTIIDVKTGSPSPAHSAQVMLYMYAVPRAMEQHHGVGLKRSDLGARVNFEIDSVRRRQFSPGLL